MNRSRVLTIEAIRNRMSIVACKLEMYTLAVQRPLLSGKAKYCRNKRGKITSATDSI